MLHFSSVRKIISDLLQTEFFPFNPWSVIISYHFIQPLIPSNIPTELKQPKKVLSPTDREAEGLKQRSQDVPSQVDHSPPREGEATESEAESLKFEEGTELKGAGMWCMWVFCLFVFAFPNCQAQSWVMYYPSVVINLWQVRIVYIG